MSLVKTSNTEGSAESVIPGSQPVEEDSVLIFDSTFMLFIKLIRLEIFHSNLL